MMSKPIGAIFGVLTLVAILAIAPPAFAESGTTVNIAAGAGSGPNCSQSSNCFNPDTVTVAPGTTVEWQNNDKVSHTVTSGNPSDNQTGTVFDSSLIAAGKSFSFTFNNPGTYNYFCQVHPWMTGQVIVSTSAASSGSTAGTTSGSSSMNMSSGSTGMNMSSGTTSGSSSMNMSSGSTANTTSSTPTQSAPSTTVSTNTPSTTTSSAPSTGDQYSGNTAQSNTAPASTTSNTAPTMSTENANPDQMTGWSAGIGIAAVMSGIGIWSAVRRR